MIDGQASEHEAPDDQSLTWDIVPDAEGVRVRLFGTLDLATAPSLRARLDEARAHSQHVILDLRQLDFMDSSGLRLFLDLAADARRDGFSMSLIEGPAAVQRVFVITGTTAAFSFQDA
jgi:anti-anti-sigma factor